MYFCVNFMFHFLKDTTAMSRLRNKSQQVRLFTIFLLCWQQLNYSNFFSYSILSTKYIYERSEYSLVNYYIGNVLEGFFVRFIYLKRQIFGERKRERERMFNMLVHSPSSHNNQSWADPNLGAKSFSRSYTWVQEPQAWTTVHYSPRP